MTIKRNIIANFAGSIWSALMLLAFVPLYIRLMGVESYGIVGVFSSLMAMLAVLDLGLTQTMNREMAKLSVDGQSAQRLADTARTLEILYWGVALLVGAVTVLLSGFIAYHWLNPEQLSRDALQQALWIMALVIALRWPVALYTGGLNGLQRQVQANVILVVVATLQGAGALAVLWFIEPSIRAFFCWQAVVALVQVAILRTALWHNLPNRQTAVFSKSVLLDIWRFAAGMSGISLLAIILTQLDKVLLSKMLTLTEFGYYTFAATVAALTGKVVGPIFTAYSPRLSALVAQGNRSALVNTYHQGCQLVVIAIVPLVLMLSVFSSQILDIWVQDPVLVSHSAILFSLLLIGNGLNGLMTMPYALQIAHGWTRLAFYTNLVAVILLAPAIYAVTLRWGAEGAAWVWVCLNAGYLLFNVQIMHRRLLTGEKQRWYWQDTLYPISIASLVVGVAYVVMQGLSGISIAVTALALMGFFIAAFALVAIATPLGQGAAARFLKSSPQAR